MEWDASPTCNIRIKEKKYTYLKLIRANTAVIYGLQFHRSQQVFALLIQGQGTLGIIRVGGKKGTRQHPSGGKGKNDACCLSNG